MADFRSFPANEAYALALANRDLGEAAALCENTAAATMFQEMQSTIAERFFDLLQSDDQSSDSEPEPAQVDDIAPMSSESTETTPVTEITQPDDQPVQPALVETPVPPGFQEPSPANTSSMPDSSAPNPSSTESVNS